MFHVALYYNASAWFASLTEFSAAVWPTVAGCFEPCWPHDPQAPARLLVSPSEFALVARLTVALQRHRGPCWHEECPNLQRWDQTSISDLCETSGRLLKMNPRLLYFWQAIPLENCHPELANLVECDVGDVDHLELCMQFPCDFSKLEEFLNCG